MPEFNFQNSYTQLPEELYTAVVPTKVAQPALALFNQDLAQELGLSLKKEGLPNWTELLSGNRLPAGAASIAQAYAGHQFGHFTLLGDGRAILLGEQLTPLGERFDIQLKGAGITPYSRRGDGKATLSSMLREYVFSEAVHALGIPSTRSLAVVATGEAVYREQAAPGGVLTRVAQSHIRVGTFEYARHFCAPETLEALMRYTIERHYPHLQDSTQPALDLLEQVMVQQVKLVVNWLRVGFVHGVMNTDNMALSGETIDYGPCAFINGYQPGAVFSSIDQNGRYAFDQQPGIVLWNLSRLAESLLPLVDADAERAVAKATAVLERFETLFKTQYHSMMCAKLGIMRPLPEDEGLVSELLQLMESQQADYTNTFVQLLYPEQDLEPLFQTKGMQDWLVRREKRLAQQDLSTRAVQAFMQKQNPVYIPRNYRVEEALQQAATAGNRKPLQELLAVVTRPYVPDRFQRPYMEGPKAGFDQDYQTFCGT